MKTRKNNDNITKIRFCGTFGCCPTIEFKKGLILIKDDFGGRVKLNKDQWNDLVKKSKEIK